MNKTFKQSDGSFFGNSEFFIAKITDKHLTVDLDTTCNNWECSWQQMVPCTNLRGYTDKATGLLYGDIDTGYNLAYPISGDEPEIDSIVLMRFRGTVDQTINVFEFMSAGAAMAPPESCCRILNAACSNGYLAVTYSDACTPSTSSSPVPVGNVIEVDGSQTILLWGSGTEDYVYWG